MALYESRHPGAEGAHFRVRQQYRTDVGYCTGGSQPLNALKTHPPRGARGCHGEHSLGPRQPPGGQSRAGRPRGQGRVEYAPIILLVVLAVVVARALLGPQIAAVFPQASRGL